MNKKTRNTLSGILVGVASVYAVINFAEIPAEEVRNFVFATVVFFAGIVLLALVAVSVFKLLGLVKRRLTDEDDTWEDSLSDLHEKDQEEPSGTPEDVADSDDKA